VKRMVLFTRLQETRRCVTAGTGGPLPHNLLQAAAPAEFPWLWGEA
jgi:hypothetical protein